MGRRVESEKGKFTFKHTSYSLLFLSHILLSCMCVWCMYVYMMCALCVNVHKCVPQSKCGGQRTTSMLVLTFYLVWHRALCTPGWLAGERQGLSSLFLQSHNRDTEVTEWCYWTWLYVGSRCSNSGPHAFTVSTLSHCPSPYTSPFLFIFKGKWDFVGKIFCVYVRHYLTQ